MMLYDYNSNAILTEPLKNNNTAELARVQMRLTQYLLDRGLNTTALRIENECPEDLQRFSRANSIDFQLCPPNNHSTNQEEKAIGTWKCHFLAGLSGVDLNSPLHIWCRRPPPGHSNLKPTTYITDKPAIISGGPVKWGI